MNKTAHNEFFSPFVAIATGFYPIFIFIGILIWVGLEHFVQNSGREAWVPTVWIGPLLLGVVACFAIGGWQVQTWRPKSFYWVIMILLVTRLLKFATQSLSAPPPLPSHLELASIQAASHWSYLVFPSWYHLLYLISAVCGLLLGKKCAQMGGGKRTK